MSNMKQKYPEAIEKARERLAQKPKLSFWEQVLQPKEEEKKEGSSGNFSFSFSFDESNE
jgi:hypothetical protein